MPMSCSRPKMPIFTFPLLSPLLATVFLFAPLRAEEKNLLFSHLSLGEGLSQVSVRCIHQDRQGYMWFGTEGGLNRYDGNQFTFYKHRPADPDSLADNVVHALLEDRRGNLWVGTGSGRLDCFDPRTGVVRHFTADANAPGNVSGSEVRVLLETGDSANPILWVGMQKGGLQRYETASRRLTVYRRDPTRGVGPASDNINCLAVEPGSGGRYLWVGTSAGLNRLDVQTGRFSLFGVSPGGVLSHNAVRALLFADAQTLWVGTGGGGLNRLDVRTGAVTVFRKRPGDPNSLSDDFVNTLLIDSAGRLWVGTENGLNLHRPATSDFRRYQRNPYFRESLSDNQVVSLFEDRSQVLWVGTWSGGVNKADNKPEQFATLFQIPGDPGSLAHDTVRAVVQDQTGAIWVGTTEGLDRVDRAGGRITHFRNDPERAGSLSYNYILDLHLDPAGILWVGTLQGLNRYDPQKESFVSYFSDPANPTTLSSNEIQRIADDPLAPDRFLWIGTRNDGLDRFDKQTGACTHFRHEQGKEASLGHNKVYAILPTPDGALWLGTWGGLDYFDPQRGEFRHYRNRSGDLNSLSNDRVTTLVKDPGGAPGILWVGTWGGGLNRFDSRTGVFRSYSEDFGLPTDLVSGILTDNQGRLWISTPQGLVRFDPRTEGFRIYAVTVGETPNAFNAGAFFQSPSGELFFGGIRGLTSFFPDRLRDNPHPPPVVLTSFKIFSKEAVLPQPLAETREIVLNYQDRLVSFEFAGLEYTAPDRNNYRYRLEGFDRDWIPTEARHRQATYTNLEPGEYVFRVQACNSDGVWNRDGVAVRVVMVPPFWRTLWFRLSLAAAALLLVGFVFRQRVRHIQRRARELEESNRVLNREIGERQRAEEQVRKSEHRLQTFLDTAKEGFIEIDSQQIILDVNPEMCQIMGRPRQELLGRSFLDFIRQEDMERMREELRRRKEGHKGSYNLTLFTPDMTPVYCLVNATPLFNGDGRPRGSFAMITNMTEMRKAESQLRQAQKMEIIGSLAGGLAHDFNNVLGGISGTLGVVRYRFRERDSVSRADLDAPLRLIEDSAARAADMVKRLLTLARKQELSFQWVNLAESLRNVLQLCENTFGRHQIEIRALFPEHPVMVHADPTQVEQVFLNLCVNASHAMTIMRKDDEPPGGFLTVAIRRILADRIFCFTHNEAEERREYWVVSITDTGVGMSTKVIAKMFDPFFTTKEKGVGTGLGLSTVYSIVHQHQGFFDVYSEVGIGTTFNVYFPAPPAGVESPAEAVDEAEPPRGSGLVLVADDEGAIRDTAKAFLEYCGYSVILAEDGQEAVEIFRERRDEIRVVLMDVVMPRMTGREAFAVMKAIKPDVRVIISSGFQIDARVQAMMEAGIHETILKPFSLRELAHKIAALQ